MNVFISGKYSSYFQAVISCILLLISVPECLATGLSVSESVTANPEQEIQQMEVIDEKNPVFGYNLFKGKFRDIQQPSFNPDYIVNIGDIINVRIWGAIEFAQEMAVDTQGNIFLPKVGTVKVLGVKNKDLVTAVQNKMKMSYKDMVFCYANVTNYQPITVFVTGNVNLPGLYKGMSSDSVLQYIDRAGGIALDFGSFRDIEIVRSNKAIKKIDLYSFLVSGRNDLFQFQNGDVITVNNLMHQISVSGDVVRPFKFEFSKAIVPIQQVIDLAMLKPETTNYTITRWQRDNEQQLFSGSLMGTSTNMVMAGDAIEFFSDHTSRLEKIYITGEHDGLDTILIDKDENLGHLLKNLKLSSRSNPSAVQVFRKSVAEKQKELLLAHLQSLESVILTSSAVTSEESQILAQESKSYLNFIERARQVEPKGQIIINDSSDINTLFLEDGDQIYIPSITNLTMVQGEVSIPGTHTIVEGYTAYDYLQLAGGLTERADTENILIISQNGSVKKFDSERALKSVQMLSGDSILVMPKVTGKNIQMVKGVTQIMYQIAVSVGVLLAL